MKRMRFWGLPMIGVGIMFVGVMGLAIAGLWNLLMPAIFQLPSITFWQALGLFLLSRLLFGRFGGFGRRMRRARFVKGWDRLTPEERQRFREAMGPCRPGFFGEGGAPAEKA